jgi:type I restriction enzyme S subunit
MSFETVTFEALYSEPSRNGLTRPKSVRGDGYKMVNMKEIFAFNRICNPDMELVPLNDKEKVAFSLKKGDLLFARQSLVAEGAGKCSIVLDVPDITTFESHLIRTRLDLHKATPLFYYYYFNSPQGKGNVRSLVMQVAAAGIRGSELAKLSIPFPPLETQRKIASILSAYDDLIENNTRRIKILEEMARIVYREWFVNFRFPRHDGRDVPVARLALMPQHTGMQQQTPHRGVSTEMRMVDSPLGMIPEGWEVTPVTEAVEISPRTKVSSEGEKPFVPMGSLSNDSMLISDIETRSGNSGTKFRNGDTLFARITPCLENGKTGFVQFLPNAEATAFGSTEFIVLRSETLCPEYVYLMARSSEFRENAIKSMSGATGRQRVSEKCFEQFFIAQPDAATLEKFSGITTQMFKQIQVLATKNQNLRQTRDLLLPKLISGEVAV